MATPRKRCEWLGHARLDTTGRYLDLTPDSLHEAIKRTTTNRLVPNQDAVAQTIQELSGFITRVGDIDINAFAVLGRLWGDFTGSMTPSELLTRLTKELSLSVVDLKVFGMPHFFTRGIQLTSGYPARAATTRNGQG